MDERQLMRSLRLGLAAVAVMLILATAIGYQNIEALYGARQRGTVTRQVTDALEEIESHLSKADLALQRYLLLSQPDALNELQDEVTKLDSDLVKLSGVNLDSLIPEDDLARLKSLVANRRTEMTKIVEQSRDADDANVGRLLSRYEQRQTAAAINDLLRDLDERGRAEIAERRAVSESYYRKARLSSLIFGALALTLVVCFWQLLKSQFRKRAMLSEALRSESKQLRAARDELSKLNQSLASQVADRSAELRQSQKMEAVGQLTGGLAHDFNNILAGISGNLEILSLRLAQGSTAEVGRYMRAAQDLVKRAGALTHQLLAFSRRQSLNPVRSDIHQVVLGLDDLIRLTLGPAINLNVISTSPLWTVLIDAHQLENAVVNLCINARDAMPDGGSLSIETRNVVLIAEESQKLELAPGDYVLLTVSDTGSGMTPDVIAHAFEPFFTTKPLGEGTGLGLSMIYGFVRQSGGQIQIHSTPGISTTISIYLPRNETADVKTLTNASKSILPTPERQHRATILVVEDEETIRSVVIDQLSEMGHMVLSASEAESALVLLRSEIIIDLLVTDVGLPGGLNGRQLADAGRVIQPGMRVLYMTGYAKTMIEQNKPLEQGSQILMKPFTLDALETNIRDLLTSPTDNVPASSAEDGVNAAARSN